MSDRQKSPAPDWHERINSIAIEIEGIRLDALVTGEQTGLERALEIIETANSRCLPVGIPYWDGARNHGEILAGLIHSAIAALEEGRDA